MAQLLLISQYFGVHLKGIDNLDLKTDYANLKQEYGCYNPYFEVQRQSIENIFYHYLIQGNSKDLNEFLEKNTDKEISNEFKQKWIGYT